jgi:uncharacterized Zn-finger protein
MGTRWIISFFIACSIYATYLFFAGYTANLTDWPWWGFFAIIVIQAIIQTVLKGTIPGQIFVLAISGSIFFAAKLAYDMYEISAVDKLIDTYPSIYQVPTSIMARAFALPEQRARDAVFLGIFVIASIVSGIVKRNAARKLSADWEKFLDTEAKVKSGPAGTNISDEPTKKAVTCPGCSTELSLPAGKTGKVKCPRCSRMFAAAT